MSAHRIVGPVTVHATLGTALIGSLGLALVDILVYVWPVLDPIRDALVVVLATLGALLGGYAAPPAASRRQAGGGDGTAQGSAG